ncbi:hypothetical protein C8F04DRAFT_1199572 [Mycena alexandri]|uniref:Uncharacterized protein n=1 Tax=Mycena alexandri TaxID=1745969 RepID=A0AAD6RZ88_9AGAR|nr:hypothetical protein C8F04DRAFT_1199572 [Mycena alexandri]
MYHGSGGEDRRVKTMREWAGGDIPVSAHTPCQDVGGVKQVASLTSALGVATLSRKWQGMVYEVGGGDAGMQTLAAKNRGSGWKAEGAAQCGCGGWRAEGDLSQQRFGSVYGCGTNMTREFPFWWHVTRAKSQKLQHIASNLEAPSTAPLQRVVTRIKMTRHVEQGGGGDVVGASDEHFWRTTAVQFACEQLGATQHAVPLVCNGARVRVHVLLPAFSSSAPVAPTFIPTSRLTGWGEEVVTLNDTRSASAPLFLPSPPCSSEHRPTALFGGDTRFENVRGSPEYQASWSADYGNSSQSFHEMRDTEFAEDGAPCGGSGSSSSTSTDKRGESTESNKLLGLQLLMHHRRKKKARLRRRQRQTCMLHPTKHSGCESKARLRTAAAGHFIGDLDLNRYQEHANDQLKRQADH